MASRITRSNSQNLSFSLEDIEKLIVASEKRVTDRLEGALKEIHLLNDRITHQQEEIKQLKAALIDAEKRWLADDRRDRARNIIIRGLQEDEEEDSEDLEGSVDEIFQALDVDEGVKSAERIGKPGQDRPRLVKVVASSVGQRNTILKKARLLRTNDKFRGIYLDSDKCFWDRKEGARLRQRAGTLRDENPGKSVKIYKGKLLLEWKEADRENPLRFLFSSA